MMDFISWDDDIPNGKSHKIPWFQSTKQILNFPAFSHDVPMIFPWRQQRDRGEFPADINWENGRSEEFGDDVPEFAELKLG